MIDLDELEKTARSELAVCESVGFSPPVMYANPATVLALVQVVKAAREVVGNGEQYTGSACDHCVKGRVLITALAAVKEEDAR